jgi:cellobiose-specific phosphotransferase system component IIA
MRRMLLFMLVLTSVAVTVLAQEEPRMQTEDKELQKSYLYQWTDDNGIIHITDNLGKVPKQYHDRAVKLTQPKKEAGDEGKQVQQRSVYPSGAQSEAAIAALKDAWQQRMRNAKQRLANAEKRYQELDQHRNELLRNWGADAFGVRTGRIEAEKIEQQMKDLQKEIDEARHDVEVVIPEEARKADVPPGWLRE